MKMQTTWIINSVILKVLLLIIIIIFPFVIYFEGTEESPADKVERLCEESGGIYSVQAFGAGDCIFIPK